MYLEKAIHKEIMIEFGFNEENKKTIIILPGLPFIPRPKNLMDFLVTKGYNTIYVRYPGTYESEGSFAKENPANCAVDLIKHLKENGKFIELYNNEERKFISEKIILVGGSFGGLISLSAAEQIEVNKIIALSPVISMRKLCELDEQKKQSEQLKSFMKTGFRNTIRFNDEDYDKLCYTDEIIPLIDMNKITCEVKIILAKDDQTVPEEHIISNELPKKTELITLEEGGHLGPSSFTEEEMLKFIEE